MKLTNGKLPPGRYAAVVRVGEIEDENAIVGYDEILQTHFFQSGSEHDDGSPVVWIGVRHQEFPTLISLERRLEEMGVQIAELEFESWFGCLESNDV